MEKTEANTHNDAYGARIKRLKEASSLIGNDYVRDCLASIAEYLKSENTAPGSEESICANVINGIINQYDK